MHFSGLFCGAPGKVSKIYQWDRDRWAWDRGWRLMNWNRNCAYSLLKHQANVPARCCFITMHLLLPLVVSSSQGRSSSASSQSQGGQQSMRSGSSSKHPSSSNASSYSLLQPLVPEVKDMGSAYTRLNASNPMVGERAAFPRHRPTGLPSCLLPTLSTILTPAPAPDQ